MNKEKNGKELLIIILIVALANMFSDTIYNCSDNSTCDNSKHITIHF